MDERLARAYATSAVLLTCACEAHALCLFGGHARYHMRRRDPRKTCRNLPKVPHLPRNPALDMRGRDQIYVRLRAENHVRSRGRDQKNPLGGAIQPDTGKRDVHWPDGAVYYVLGQLNDRQPAGWLVH